MSGHTPGPWRHIAETKPQAGRHWHCIEAEVDTGDDNLSWVTISEFYDHTGPLMDTPDAEIAANAKLAAAAPDLLAALKAWRDATTPSCFDDAVKLREAAIAKAEGWA